MRILICDDDMLITEQLNKYLHDFFERNHLKCPEIVSFSDGESLLSDSGEKDILFLDVEMPGLNGIYVGNELKKVNDNIIIFIVTSYTEYLDEAMRFHVFRYLSKPLDRQRLFRNLKDAIKLYNTSTIKLPVETKQGIHTVSATDIISVEALGRKIIVHTVSKDYESVHNMKYWINTLPANGFFQSHRSFIINLQHVTDFDRSLIHLYNNQFEAYLTRRKYTQFKETYLLYLESTR
ncbi:MAG: LytTR family DNA-binding domain-containing protein [Lachnospiraceae bacterium]|nr:LytTR family DNA-binding domain-containing protein [Lachnospiraceae bacterium]MDE6252874.1 LytTR family DNA-binding domain-containing protein [Lachnospiraceae bacterium]